MQEELYELHIEQNQKAFIPMGYQKIFSKKILPYMVERDLKFHSKKYNKLDYPFAVSKKPISKIVSYKNTKNENKD